MIKLKNMLTEEGIIEKLPKDIQSAINRLRTKWGVIITDRHIEKEFDQEGGTRPDNGSVDPIAEKQILKLIAAVKQKFPLIKNQPGIISSYRSYMAQADNFGRKVNSGRSIDNVQSANTIPGFSQHHTGKAFDIFSVKSAFWNKHKDVADYIKEIAPKYGFDVTYKTQGTLRIAEPWHLYYTN